MRKSLILITNSFPYGKGEEFIYNELIFLSKKFESIYIIPYLKIGEINTDKINFHNIQVLKYNTSIQSKLFALFNINFWKILKTDFSSFRMLLHRFSLIYTLKKIIKSNNIDKDNTVFYSYWYNSLGSALIYFDSFLAEIKYGIRVHGYDYDHNQHPANFRYKYRKPELQLCKEIFGISNFSKNYFKENHAYFKGNFSIQKLGTLDNGISELNNSDPAINIVSCSYIVDYKRVSLILETLLQIKKIRINWTHIGEGSSLNSLKKQAKKAPSNIKITFKGYLDNKAVLDFYKNTQFDFLIHLSEMEGVPVAIMEAISFGIPVIACDAGGVNEVVNENTGYLLPVNFQSNEIINILENYSTLEMSKKLTLRNSARKYWLENYASEKNASQLFTYLNNM